jgi:hypothetical protein
MGTWFTRDDQPGRMTMSERALYLSQDYSPLSVAIGLAVLILRR